MEEIKIFCLFALSPVVQLRQEHRVYIMNRASIGVALDSTTGGPMEPIRSWLIFPINTMLLADLKNNYATGIATFPAQRIVPITEIRKTHLWFPRTYINCLRCTEG